jgi:hypothetical protein
MNMAFSMTKRQMPLRHHDRDVALEGFPERSRADFIAHVLPASRHQNRATPCAASSSNSYEFP